MKKVGFLTLGCKVNQYESAVLAEHLARLGFEIADQNDICDYYVVNTCTVTSEADRKSRQMIRRAIHKNPNAHVIVAGCYAQVNEKALSAIDGVDVIVGTRTKLSIVDKILELEAGKSPVKSAIESLYSRGFESMMLDGSFGGGTEERTRAYVKIEDGCDSNCTYCIIPKARGSVSSKPVSDVVSEVERLVSRGYLEVVLTGIETGAYGRDFNDGTRLVDLLERVDRIDGLERIRLGSLDPSIMKKDTVERLAKLKKLAPHFHLSVQSGSDAVLARMKRKYNTTMMLEYMDDIRRHMPEVMFTTDIICGFPGETDEEFNETREFVNKARFLSAHVFAYSKRSGTPAAQMPDQIPHATASKRVAELYEMTEKISDELKSEYDGRAVTVIPEEYKNGVATGHTANFICVGIPCDTATYESIHAKLVTVKLSVKDGNVMGEIVK